MAELPNLRRGMGTGMEHGRGVVAFYDEKANYGFIEPRKQERRPRGDSSAKQTAAAILADGAANRFLIQ